MGKIGACDRGKNNPEEDLYLISCSNVKKCSSVLNANMENLTLMISYTFTPDSKTGFGRKRNRNRFNFKDKNISMAFIRTILRIFWNNLIKFQGCSVVVYIAKEVFFLAWRLWAFF